MTELVHPWNLELAKTLAQDLDRLPHALLLAGPRGLGKNHFAAWLAQRLLCQQPASPVEPCGQCQSCQLYRSGSQPDLHVVQPEAYYKNSSSLLAKYAVRYPPEDKSRDSKDSTVIRIDQIRALIEASHTRPQIAARKVLLISPADTLNINAANSLLKLLEEPPADSHLVLVADRPARLSATIRSRCNRVEFRIPQADRARAWLISRGIQAPDDERLLALAGGAPLEALALAENQFLAQREQLMSDLELLLSGQGDPLACAARWRQIGADRSLHWLQGWLADLIHTSQAPESRAPHNPDAGPRLQAHKKRLHLRQLFNLAEMVAHKRQMLGGSLDEQLLLEDLLICWAESRTT
jgi:DNA polymerase-3 subunit delta'